MTRDKFGQLFRTALDTAAQLAEDRLGRPVPRHYEIVLHGAGHSGDRLPPEVALNELYLGSDRFFAIIDVTVTEVGRDSTTLFVRASAHRPIPFEETWNTPPGNGPFKQLVADSIRHTDALGRRSA
jgi:hypothetical protein